MRRWMGIPIYLVLSVLALVILFPYFVMAITALKSNTQVFAYPPSWLPHPVDLRNFVDLFAKDGFGRVLLNSLLDCGVSTILAVVVAIPASYAISRLRFPLRRAMIYLFLVTQMFSPIVIIVGLFRVMVLYHLLNNPLSLILSYAAFNLAFSIWILSSFFDTIPAAIEEAAWIDGCSRWQGVVRVFVPLALPGMLVACMFSFVAAWNDLVLAMSFLRSSSRFTVTLRIFNLVSGRYTVEWQLVMAAVVIATIPVVVMFALMQKHLVQGFTAGAVK
jgi:multiple sugar transport system permease protein